MNLKSYLFALAPALLLVFAVRPDIARPVVPPPSIARSPSDLAISADGSFAVTANTGSNTISLVDLKAGRPVTEAPTGKAPFAIALSRDSQTVIVTNRLDDTITLFRVTHDSLQSEATFPVGDEPRGVAISADGQSAYVALAGESVVAFVNLAQRRVEKRLPVGAEPWHLSLTSDGKRLAVGCARAEEMCLVDVTSRRVASVVKLRGHNVRHVAITPDGNWAYVPNIAERGRSTIRQNIDNGWVVGNRLNRVPLREAGTRETIALDQRGNAVADVDGSAISPDGGTVALTCAGTHELLLLRGPLPFLDSPADHVDPDLAADEMRYQRVQLGGRPMGAAFTPDGRSIVVTNYLSNSLEVIDSATGQPSTVIPLSGPSFPDLARRGEAIFLDADRSFRHWYSCNTCHVEGHTNGSDFDTFNDGSYGTLKKTLSLRGVTQTGPWTWHGRQTDLRKLVHDSMTVSMQGPEPSEADLDAVMAYLATLDFKPNPHHNADGSLSASAARGAAVFKAKRCDTCHAPPTYTTPSYYVVGLESEDDAYKGFNPPSLKGVYNRSPYLHTCEANTLEEVLTKYHRPSKLTGKPNCTPSELADLVAFLKTL